MSPLLLVLLGMAIVLCGVLVFKLHAFLALIIAAMVVAALTPAQTLRNQSTAQMAIGKVTRLPDAENPHVRLAIDKSKTAGIETGTILHVLHRYEDDDAFHHLADVQVVSIATASGDAIAKVEWDGRLLGRKPNLIEVRMHQGDLLFHPTQVDAALSPKVPHLADRVAEGFGKTCIDIGILIALAAIIGECLLASGAAERTVRSTLSLLGEKRAPAAFMGSGFVLGIPVFFDTVFYLLIPLAKAMRRRTGKNYLLYVLTIVGGATMTHSLVPPTPGPLFAASAFKVNVGTMILAGLCISAITAMVGYAYAVWANRRWDIPLRDSAEGDAVELADSTQADDAALPPLWLSLLPIVLPVVLIAGHSVVEAWHKSLLTGDALPWWLASMRPTLQLIGHKNIALLLAAIIAMVTLYQYKRAGGPAGGLEQSAADQPQRHTVARALNVALASGGVVILITAAGGAFGLVLRQTGIASEIQHLATGWQIGVLPVAFLVTTMVRTAQGSATVAMITAAAIFAPIVEGDTLAFHPVYLALAVGCGSKPIMWMNDSGFWVITKMSGLRESETLKTATVMMILMALSGLAAIMAAAVVLPLK